MSSTEEQKSLEQTPTWAVATVCTVFVVASLLLERGIHALGRYFKKNKQKELYHTLDQIKDELMLLGFISLFLTVFQPKVASICMPERLNRIMLPCKYKPAAEAPTPAAAHRRRLMAQTTTVSCSPVLDNFSPHLSLAPKGLGCDGDQLAIAAVDQNQELNKHETPVGGHVQVISTEGLHQLHIFIFVMAVVHVLYSCLTVLIGIWQVHSWKKWEKEAHDESFQAMDNALHTKHKKAGGNFIKNRITYKFLQTSRTGLNLDSYVYSFFRQFGRPIYKEDYLCLRLGFLATHKLPDTYDFHSYIRRSMEQDFKVVVGISGYLWGFVCIFLLMDIYGWYTYLWMAFIPTLMILIIGMKLQQIITDLALEVRGGVQKIETTLDDLDGHIVDKPKKEFVMTPIKARDDLFWFHRPRFLLYLVHFILFQNAFELAFFFWAMVTYGFTSCLLGRAWMIIVRLLLGAFVQVLCSASTLPLYALVSQLGSHIKDTVFKSEATASAIHGWRKKAKDKHKEHGAHHQKTPLAKKPLGILGLTKELNKHGHPMDIELPHTNGAQQHRRLENEERELDQVGAIHIHEHGHDEHHPHPHSHHHHPQGGSHMVEIMENLSAAVPQKDEVKAETTPASNQKSLAAVNRLLIGATKKTGD